jgi:hypothetical protein
MENSIYWRCQNCGKIVEGHVKNFRSLDKFTPNLGDCPYCKQPHWIRDEDIKHSRRSANKIPWIHKPLTEEERESLMNDNYDDYRKKRTSSKPKRKIIKKKSCGCK